MAKLSEREWMVLDRLWESGGATLGELFKALYPETGWSRNTVLTYLTRMEAKGMVSYIEQGYPRRYQAVLSREEWRRNLFLTALWEQGVRPLRQYRQGGITLGRR